MNLQDELRLRTGNLAFKDIALMMKYIPRKAVQAGNRIWRVINSKNLGLDAGGYDFKYSDAEFVLKLCDVLGMDTDECSSQVEKLNTQLFEYRVAYKPWLFIDTDFHRTTEPIHALAFMESIRRIKLDDELVKFPLHQQVAQVKLLIVRHFEGCSGFLPVWGNIQKYVLHYSAYSTVVFDTAGNILNTGESNYQPPASVTIGGPDLTKVIKVRSAHIP